MPKVSAGFLFGTNGKEEYTRLTSTNCAEADKPSEYVDISRFDVSRKPYPEGVAERRFKKAYARYCAGRNLGNMVFVTLTTPASFKGDLHRAWRLFLWRCRNKNVRREYFVVREWNEKHTCEHLHVVFRTDDELSAALLRWLWCQAVNASGNLDLETIWTKHRRVFDGAGVGSYLGKYLLKNLADEPRKRHYWYATSWICRGYAGMSKALWICGQSIDAVNLKLLRACPNLGYAQFKLLVGAHRAYRKEGFWGETFVYSQIYKALKRSGLCMEYFDDEGGEIGV